MAYDALGYFARSYFNGIWPGPLDVIIPPFVYPDISDFRVRSVSIPGIQIIPGINRPDVYARIVSFDGMTLEPIPIMPDFHLKRIDELENIIEPIPIMPDFFLRAIEELETAVEALPQTTEVHIKYKPQEANTIITPLSVKTNIKVKRLE